jgi:hypothetical protein
MKRWGDFDGVIGRTVAESSPSWPARPHPAQDAPDVVLLLLDDTGFAQLGCYGSTTARVSRAGRWVSCTSSSTSTSWPSRPMMPSSGWTISAARTATPTTRGGAQAGDTPFR